MLRKYIYKIIYVAIEIRERREKSLEIVDVGRSTRPAMPYLITTKYIEYSYALLKLICTDSSLHRCIDGMADL